MQNDVEDDVMRDTKWSEIVTFMQPALKQVLARI